MFVSVWFIARISKSITSNKAKSLVCVGGWVGGCVVYNDCTQENFLPCPPAARVGSGRVDLSRERSDVADKVKRVSILTKS